MPKLQWDVLGKRFYETGTDRAVLFVTDDTGAYGNGVAWSGLTKVTESPEGGEETALYADNIKYLSLYSTEVLKGTIEAYTYPDEFEACDGSAEIATGVTIGQQTRKPFAFAYRTKIGNDVKGATYGYKLHLIYGVRVSPSERAYETVNETPGAVTFSWAFSSTPVDVEGFEPSSSIVIDSTKAPAAQLKALEDMLYGAEAAEAKMPTPAEVLAMFKADPETQTAAMVLDEDPEADLDQTV